MGNSLLSIGLTGVQAAQAGLLTTSHNITNASTPGFSRQSIVQTSNIALYSGAGYIGQGANVETIRRTYSQFLNQQVLSADTRYQELSTYYDQIKQIDNLLGDATAGLSPALQDFFSGIQSIAADPSSIPARQSMLSQADALVGRLQSLNSRLDEMRTQSSNEIANSVVEINSLATQIGQLNQQIIYANNLGVGTANDLLDKRDDLVSQLNQQIRVTVQTNDDSSINVFIGNGQPLVVGTMVGQLTTGPSAEDISKLAVGIKMPTGGSQQLPESTLSGGKLSGLLMFRSQAIDLTQNSLGRIAMSLTQTLNAQNRLGIDLNGNLGGDLFTPLAGHTIYPNQPTNAGTAQIDVPITDANDLTLSDYSLTYTADNTFQLVRRTDGQTWTATGTDPQDALGNLLASVPTQGFSLNLTGAPAVGDSFLIQPTRFAVSEFSKATDDPRLIAAGAPITTAAANSNVGNGKIDEGSVTSVANLAAGASPALNLPLTLTFSGGNLNGFPADFPVTVTQPDGTVANYPAGSAVPYTPGAKIELAGIGFTISGEPVNGDTFSIQANTNGVSDNRNAVLLGQLQQAKTMLGGSASYASAYAQLVSQIGTQTRTAQVAATSQQTILQQATDARDSMSAVSLDDEAANLIRYQQAYQASGKVMEIASKLFDTILAVVNS